MDFVRTPDSRFDAIADFPFAPRYFESQGLRIHYIDEGNAKTGVTFLCLHGEPTWSYLYRQMVPVLSRAGRVLVPDLAGFGKSDKPTRLEDYTFAMHFSVLADFLRHAGAENVVLICQDWGGLLGLPLAMEFEQQFAGLVIMNTGLPDPAQIAWVNPVTWLAAAGFAAWRTFATMHPDLPVGQVVSGGCWPPMRLAPEVVAAYDAPFPDKTYKAGVEAFPRLVPVSKDHPTVPYMQRARANIEKSRLRKLVMFSNRDPITWAQRSYFENLPNVIDTIPIRGAGHFLQEDKGEELAHHIARHFN